MKELNDFLELLKRKEHTEIVYNQFKDNIPFNNLKQYLSYLLRYNCENLLLGEAGGYLGCRKSGIAFTSGDILAHDNLFSPLRNQLSYQEIISFKERSATIIYSVFNSKPELFTNTVLFNAFPFHPHDKNNPESNRKPKISELKDSFIYLDKLLDLFKFKRILLVGNVAEAFFIRYEKDFGINSNSIKFKIRHPSYGGKPLFLKQMRYIFKINYLKQKTVLETYSFPCKEKCNYNQQGTCHVPSELEHQCYYREKKLMETFKK